MTKNMIFLVLVILNINNVIDLNEMRKSIDNLKNIVPTKPKVKDIPPVDGETCMHGNSWNGECADCQEIGLVDSVFDLVKAYPNDQALGQKVRELYNTFNTNSDDTEE